MHDEPTSTEIVARLDAIAEMISELPLRLREEDVNDLCGAVSYLARVLVPLVEEVVAQKHAMMHVETRLLDLEEGLGGIASDGRRLMPRPALAPGTEPHA